MSSNAGPASLTTQTTEAGRGTLCDLLPDLPALLDHQSEINEVLRSLTATILDGKTE
jgi:hypothetical protein